MIWKAKNMLLWIGYVKGKVCTNHPVIVLENANIYILLYAFMIKLSLYVLIINLICTAVSREYAPLLQS